MEVQAGTFNPADFSWQGLTMTPAAAAHIRDLMRKQPDKKGLRLGIKTSGCAGFGYVLEMIAEPAPDDLLFEADGGEAVCAAAGDAVHRRHRAGLCPGRFK